MFCPHVFVQCSVFASIFSECPIAIARAIVCFVYTYLKHSYQNDNVMQFILKTQHPHEEKKKNVTLKMLRGKTNQIAIVCKNVINLLVLFSRTFAPIFVADMKKRLNLHLISYSRCIHARKNREIHGSGDLIRFHMRIRIWIRM